jgi:hypothetical protein
VQQHDQWSTAGLGQVHLDAVGGDDAVVRLCIGHGA